MPNFTQTLTAKTRSLPVVAKSIIYIICVLGAFYFSEFVFLGNRLAYAFANWGEKSSPDYLLLILFTISGIISATIPAFTAKLLFNFKGKIFVISAILLGAVSMAVYTVDYIRFLAN